MLALPAAAPAPAADGGGRFAGHGPGLASCEQLLPALQGEATDRALFIGYVAGFLTAANAYKAQIYDVAPWQPVEFVANVVVEQCTRNPAGAVTEIMVAVTEELARDGLRASSDLVTAEHDGRRVVVYREVLRRAQVRLSELGHEPGDADGAYGRRTRTALQSFQQAKGIPSTGLPDEVTLLALFYDLVPQRTPGG